MEYNVAQLMKERTGAARKYVVRETLDRIDPEIEVCDELTGNIRLLRTLDGILVTGTLRTTIESVCDRCLATYRQEVQLELEDEFKPSIDIVSGASLPVQAEDTDNVIDAHHILDMREVVRQRVLLGSPLHPLCRPDCRGLCVHCGANLNEGPCECRPAAVDPRWSALEGLLKDR